MDLIPKLVEFNCPDGFEIFFRSGGADRSIGLELVTGFSTALDFELTPCPLKLTISMSLKSTRFFFFLSST